MNNKVPEKGGKSLYIQHLESDSPKPAREYLLSLGIEKSSVDVLFDEEGNWKYKVEEEIDPYSYSPDDLKNKLIEGLRPVYDVVSRSLDSIYDLGFAKHDVPHITDVTNEVIKLLDMAEVDAKTKIIGVVAAVTHDLGNILSRKSHSKLSPLIFKLTFANFKIGKEDWLRVKDAVVYHDEPVVFEEISSWGELHSAEKVEKFRGKFRKETLALLISDKTRVNRKRLSDKNQTKEAIDGNEHYEVNLMGQTDSLTVNDKVASIKINYHPYASAEEVKIFPGFFRESKHFGYRVDVSEEMKSMHKYTTPIDNFSAWRHKYWKIYSERSMLAIYCLFALFPDVEKVSLQMIDRIYPSSTSFERVEYLVDKEELSEFERFLKLKYQKRKD